MNPKQNAFFYQFILSGCILNAAFAQQPNPPATLAELQQRLQQHISQPKFDGALWGVKIVSLDSGKTVFEQNPQKLCSPASNCKLYTVALALDRLGADYRIKTSLYAKAKPGKSGRLRGDLIVYGRGDPTINARLHGGDIYQALEPLVAALTNAGVKRITGDLVADESYFRGPPFGSGWVWDDLEYYYGAEVSALTINDNVLPGIGEARSTRGRAVQPDTFARHTLAHIQQPDDHSCGRRKDARFSSTGHWRRTWSTSPARCP